MIGFHLQRPVNNWPQAAAKLPAGAPFVAVDNLHLCRDAKISSPGLRTVYRKHWWTQHPSTNLEANKALARQYFAEFIDGTFWQQELWRYIDYYKEWNEYPMDAAHFSWLQAVCWVWRNEYQLAYPDQLGNKPLVCISRPIGNDIPVEFAQVVAQYGNVISYHNYTPVRHKVVYPNERDNFSGRWMVNDATFRQAGIFLRWMSTEGGPILHLGNGHPTPHDGWLHQDCMGGDVQTYKNVLSYQIDMCAAWNAAHGNRYLGGVLFNSGDAGGWEMFEVDQPEMNELADHIRTYSPSTPPPDPPPPPPPPPPPDPPPTTALLNGSFEGGWYHPGGSPEFQIPNDWQFDYDDTTPNPYDNNPYSQYVPPEVRVLTAAQLPPPEVPLFIRDGSQTVKIFKGHGAWWAWFAQPVTLGAGTYRLRFPVFGDLIKAYQNGQKVWADDPQQRDGQYRFIIGGRGGVWLPIIPGQWNELTRDFTHTGGAVTIGMEIRCNFALVNSGIFADAWTLQGVQTMTWQQEIWQESIDEQIARGIPLNPNAGLQQLIVTYPGNYTPVTRERTVTLADGSQRGFMAGESITGSGPRRVWSFVLPWSGPGGVTVFTDPN